MPRLFDPQRRGALLALLALGLLEAAGLAGGALLLQRAIAGPDPVLLWGLGLSCAALAAVVWGRAVLAEDFGLRFANDHRHALAAHAVAAAGAGQPRRLGTLATRLTGDLSALRDWAAIGLSDAVAGAAALAAGAVVAYAALGMAGLTVVGLAVAPVCLALLALAWPLYRQHQRLRQARGGVGAVAGDIVLSAPTLAAFAVGRREQKRLDVRAEQLRRTGVRRRQLAAVGPALAAVVVSCGALVGLSGFFAPLEPSAWPGLILSLGFAGMGAAGLARGIDSFLGFHVAELKMAAAAAVTEQGPAPAIAGIAPPGPGLAGQIARIEAAHQRYSGSTTRSAARSALALVSPALPLLRGSVRRNLTLRRSKATPAEVTAALILVGLDPAAFPPDRRIDPALGQPDPFTQARLRLARALVHRPKRLFLAEPLLLTAPDYPALVQRLSAEGITVEDDPAHAPTRQRSPAPG